MARRHPEPGPGKELAIDPMGGLFGGSRRVLYPGIIFLKISVEYLISFGTFANSQTGNNAPGEKATIERIW